MKRLVVFILTVIMILTLASPAFAVNEQPKFSREDYVYAKAEWSIGDPHDEGPFSYIIFEIGRNKTF